MISIIVDNYNRSHLLPLLIETYKNQEFQDISVEIEMIIVDDGSIDGFPVWLTLAIKKFDPWFRVKAFSLPFDCSCRSGGRTRNVAVKQSHGDILIMNSSDMIPLNKSFLEGVYLAHQDPKVYRTTRFQSVDQPSWIRKWTMPTGASISKIIYEAMGGFDERMVGYGPCGTDFMYRVLNIGQKDFGIKVVEDPDTVWIHLTQSRVKRSIDTEKEFKHNELILKENNDRKIFKVNLEGWGVCEGLKEIKL